MQKHTVLFLAADPSETRALALDREARAIHKELESAGYRERFEFVTRWIGEPLDLLRELRKLKPTVVHFSGRGTWGGEHRHGLFFKGLDGGARFVSAQAIERTFGAVGSTVKLVVLNGCYSEAQAEALLVHVDCVVGTSGSSHSDAARSFAIGFYGGLGDRESVVVACEQGAAAMSLEGVHDEDLPWLRVRAGVDASQLVLKQALLGLKIAGGRLTGSRTQEGRVRVRPDSSPPYVDVTPSCQFVVT
ncbi:MAG TPA: hypothetical protein VNO30_44380, partial [Kofleriaceae bacterium]|nr:hypothetical protein [Kofleriaceae bacterium]